MWYAYRMDVQAYGHGNTEIAYMARGSVTGPPQREAGSLTFDEFLRRLNRRWQGTTSITSLDPDVETIKSALANANFDYVADADRLFPNQFYRNQQHITFSDIWTPLGNNIKACRFKLGDAAFGTKLDNVRYAMNMVHIARLSDHSDGLIRDLQNYLQRSFPGFVRASGLSTFLLLIEVILAYPSIHY